MEKSEKSGVLVLLMCLFFGLLGVHRFIAGKIGTGVIQLLCTIFVIGLPVIGIWVFIDLIMILCGSFKDKDGKVIKLGS